MDQLPAAIATNISSRRSKIPANFLTVSDTQKSVSCLRFCDILAIILAIWHGSSGPGSKADFIIWSPAGLRGERHLSLNGLSIDAISRRHDAALSRLKHTPDLERQISKVIKWVR